MAGVIVVAVLCSLAGLAFLYLTRERILEGQSSTGAEKEKPDGAAAEKSNSDTKAENAACGAEPGETAEKGGDAEEDEETGGDAKPDVERLRRELMALAAAETVVLIALGCFASRYYGASALELAPPLLMIAVLCACTWADVRCRLIPNRVLLLGLLLRCALFCAELLLAPQEILVDLIRAAVAGVGLCGASLLCRLAVPRAIGFGDIKLLTLAGFCLGTDRAWGTVFFTMLGAFVYSLFLLMTKRATMKTEIPYAPFLLLGTVTATILLGV